jgi:hypothetical protein
MSTAYHGCVWYQRVVSLKARNRGCHYITDEIRQGMKKELEQIAVGVMHLTRTRVKCVHYDNYYSATYIRKYLFERVLGQGGAE